MESLVFAVGVVSTTVGFVSGMVVKHVQDTKHINELGSFATEQMKKVMRDDMDIIRKYQDEVIRLTQTVNRLQIERNAAPTKPATHKALIDDFFDVNQPLPEGWVEIDFPNSNKEEK